MDTVTRLTVGILGVIETTARIIKNYDTPVIEDVVAELIILQNVLAESSAMAESLQSDGPYSASLALERCQSQAKELEKVISQIDDRNKNSSGKASKKKATKFWTAAHEKDHVKQVFDSFKSAVMLFRAIATDALTHDLLRIVTQKNLDSKQPPLQRQASRPSSMVNVTLSQHISSDPTEEAPEPSEVSNRAKRMNPSEKLSIFDATISYIAEELAPLVPEDAQANPHLSSVSACNCGIRRVGRWFPIRGKFDSGANADFISDDVIRRAQLERFVVQHEETMEVKMFGETFKFDKTIKLNWQLKDEEKSCTTEFWIAPKTKEFDLIIGEKWMIEHGYQMVDVKGFSRIALMFGWLKLGRRSKAQRDREEETARLRREAALREVGQVPRIDVTLSDPVEIATNGGVSINVNASSPSPPAPPPPPPPAAAAASPLSDDEEEEEVPPPKPRRRTSANSARHSLLMTFKRASTPTPTPTPSANGNLSTNHDSTSSSTSEEQ